jgi:hypothetical protein
VSARSKLLFLLLVTIQAAHSVEEYWSRLYDVLAPAKYVSGLVSADRAVGFIIINVVILMLGACCYAFPIRSGLRTGRIVAWLWLAIEFVNGAGHVLLAASAGAYFPGALTGATLVVAALGLAASLLLDSPGPAQGPKMVQRF